MQIFADLFGIPTCRNRMKGSAAVGCAINAGMAMGVFDSYEQAIEKMVHLGDEFIPDMENHLFYTQLNNRVYQQANACLDPMLMALSPLVDA
jgi:sugar (pentulose or hexulose) kinase